MPVVPVYYWAVSRIPKELSLLYHLGYLNPISLGLYETQDEALEALQKATTEYPGDELRYDAVRMGETEVQDAPKEGE